MIAGVDISSHQGLINWSKMAGTPTRYVWMRAALGKAVDARLAENAVNARNFGFPYGFYYVIKPATTTNWKEQAQAHADLEELNGPILAPVCDAEMDGGLAKQALGDWIFKYLRRYTELTGKEMMIYTRASWWDAHVVRNDWAKQHLLWVAHYTSGPVPNIPADWGAINNPKTWTLWQWSANGNGLGGAYGCQSDDIDLDRFNGGDAEFEAVFGTKPRAQATIPPPLSTHVVTTATINPRTRPVVASDTDGGTILRGKTLEKAGDPRDGFVPVRVWLAEQYVEDV
jgi:GH25 family lysozyme M1 (1,4-beta-N-acetylmuramidase)